MRRKIVTWLSICALSIVLLAGSLLVTAFAGSGYFKSEGQAVEGSGDNESSGDTGDNEGPEGSGDNGSSGDTGDNEGPEGSGDNESSGDTGDNEGPEDVGDFENPGNAGDGEGLASDALADGCCGQYVFDGQKVFATAGENVRLNLYIQSQEGDRMPAGGVSISIYDSNKHPTGMKTKTSPKGAAKLLFDKAATYYAGTAGDGRIAEAALCKIIVKKASVKFVNGTQTLKIRTGSKKGLSTKLAVKVNGKRMDASKLTWAVGNKKILSVKNGVITAKKEGKTVVRASIYHTTASCRVTVLDKRKLIVIDPGHQAHQDSSLEPVAPGSKQLKMKVSSGTAGKYSGSEYQLCLTVSQKLRQALLKKNYRVLMTRMENDVNISNRERARVANEAGADAFIRIHANSSESPLTSGIMTICPTKESPYCQAIYKKSRRLSDRILESMKSSTGAGRGKIWETDTMTGINWCRVPVTIVELGYQSNPVEDRKLASDSYQNQLVEGMVAGFHAFFGISP